VIIVALIAWLADLDHNGKQDLVMRRPSVADPMIV
jgi:hypothetical protein